MSLEIKVLLKESIAIFAELLCQHVLTIAHIVVSMNSNKNQQVSKNRKKGQIIKTLTLKQKMKRHYTKKLMVFLQSTKNIMTICFHFLQISLCHFLSPK
jgi:hypothetical protein